MAVHVTRAGVALTVGIIIVTGLIIGGFFIVKNSGEQARREEAIKVAEQNLETQSNEGVVLNEGQDNTSESTPPSNSTDTSTSDSAAGELPQTGPSDMSAIISLGIVTFAVVAYYSSRRAVSKVL